MEVQPEFKRQAVERMKAGFYREWQERRPEEAELVICDAVQTAGLAQRCYGKSGRPELNLFKKIDIEAERSAPVTKAAGLRRRPGARKFWAALDQKRYALGSRLLKNTHCRSTP